MPAIYSKYWNFYGLQKLTERQNPMKDFNFIDSRCVVETTVKSFEISGGE